MVIYVIKSVFLICFAPVVAPVVAFAAAPRTAADTIFRKLAKIRNTDRSLSGVVVTA